MCEFSTLFNKINFVLQSRYIGVVIITVVDYIASSWSIKFSINKIVHKQKIGCLQELHSEIRFLNVNNLVTIDNIIRWTWCYEQLNKYFIIITPSSVLINHVVMWFVLIDITQGLSSKTAFTDHVLEPYLRVHILFQQN